MRFRTVSHHDTEFKRHLLSVLVVLVVIVDETATRNQSRLLSALQTGTSFESLSSRISCKACLLSRCFDEWLDEGSKAAVSRILLIISKTWPHSIHGHILSLHGYFQSPEHSCPVSFDFEIYLVIIHYQFFRTWMDKKTCTSVSQLFSTISVTWLWNLPYRQVSTMRISAFMVACWKSLARDCEVTGWILPGSPVFRLIPLHDCLRIRPTFSW